MASGSAELWKTEGWGATSKLRRPDGSIFDFSDASLPLRPVEIANSELEE